MEKLLEELDSVLKTHRPEYYSDLDDGIGQVKITELEEMFLPLAVPQNVKNLYEWKNGSSFHLTPHLTYFGIKQLIQTIHRYRTGEYHVADIENLDIYYSFLRIFCTEYIEYSMVTVFDDEDNNFIISYDLQDYEEKEFRISFSNLKNCIRYIIECTKNDAFDFEEYQCTDKELEILKQIDPNVYPLVDEYGVTKFKFDKPEDWPESMRDFKMPAFEIPEQKKKKGKLFGLFNR